MANSIFNPSHGVPDHHAGGGPVQEPLGEERHPTHHGDHDPAHHNDPASVAKEMRKYWIVFGALAGLTGVTVAISYLHLPTWGAITLALVVAAIKGGLVAAVFMHLISERKLIYAVLAITVFFFGLMLWGPWHHRNNAADVWPGYDTNATQPDNPQQTGTHDNAPPHSTPAQH
jgi:cytochrome c oxidase subunit 4